jgi:hypothetical protein
MDYLKWLSTGNDDLPKTFTAQGPQQRVEIIFRAVEVDLDLCKKKNFEILLQLNDMLGICENLDFINKLA